MLALFILYLAFTVYLLSTGAGLQRTGGVIWQVAKFAGGTGLVFALVALFASPAAAATTFVVSCMIMSLIWLPIAAVSRARDFIMPRSTVLEVICLNVLVIVIGKPRDGFPVIRQLVGFVQDLVLNPFASLIPPKHAVLNLAISLWPSFLALWLAARGNSAGRWLRFFPMVWVQIISIVWLLPVSLSALIKADAGTALSLLDVMIAALGLVHVVLTWVILRDALMAERTTWPLEHSPDSTEKIGVARRLADGMSAGHWSPPVYVLLAVLTWLGIRAALSYLPDAGLLLYGFLGCFIAGALALRLKEREPSRARVPLWLASSVALVASLHWLGHSDLLPGYWQKVNARYASQLTRGMRSPVPPAPTECKLATDFALILRCPDAYYPLALVQHPAGVEPPESIDPTPTRIWNVDWAGPTVQCQEYSARAGETTTVFLLMVVPGASRATQYLWSVEPEGQCGSFSAVTYADAPAGPVVWEYRWKYDSSRGRRDYATAAGTLEFAEPVALK